MGEILGLDKNMNFHFDVYSNELKTLISNLNDNVIDANAFDKQQIYNAKIQKGELPDDDGEDLAIFDPHAGIVDEHLTKEAQQEMIDILAPVNKDQERKEKLKMKLLDQSQQYYTNNLNIFSNGMSLLSISAHEMNNKAQVAKLQGKKMESLAERIEIH